MHVLLTLIFFRKEHNFRICSLSWSRLLLIMRAITLTSIPAQQTVINTEFLLKENAMTGLYKLIGQNVSNIHSASTSNIFPIFILHRRHTSQTCWSCIFISKWIILNSISNSLNSKYYLDVWHMCSLWQTRTVEELN
jgi:hypothetical protein